MIRVRRFTITFRLEEKGQGKITQIQYLLEVAIHSTKYLQNIEFPDRTSTNDSKMNYIRRKANSTEVMSMNASILLDSVGPPSAEVCRTAASFP
jgi:hypothetical protein